MLLRGVVIVLLLPYHLCAHRYTYTKCSTIKLEAAVSMSILPSGGLHGHKREAATSAGSCPPCLFPFVRQCTHSGRVPPPLLRLVCLPACLYTHKPPWSCVESSRLKRAELVVRLRRGLHLCVPLPRALLPAPLKCVRQSEEGSKHCESEPGGCSRMF